MPDPDRPASADGVFVRDGRAAPDPGDGSVADPALDADGEPWLFVEQVHEELDGIDLHVGFSDRFTYDHGADLDDAVALLRGLPGVTSAERQDPEEVLVVGTRDAVRLRDALVLWRLGLGDGARPS